MYRSSHATGGKSSKVEAATHYLSVQSTEANKVSRSLFISHQKEEKATAIRYGHAVPLRRVIQSEAACREPFRLCDATRRPRSWSGICRLPCRVASPTRVAIMNLAIFSLIALSLIAVALVVVGVRNARRRHREPPNERIDLFRKDQDE